MRYRHTCFPAFVLGTIFGGFLMALAAVLAERVGR
jgi:hypothetical protein